MKLEEEKAVLLLEMYTVNLLAHLNVMEIL